MEDLKRYNNKRNFNKTTEPKGKKVNNHKKLKFVVEHHLARKDHYDFRLEWDGVLKSWAVPKGPSYNTKDRRLAVRVEDHPYSYRNFEGVIPDGEYGAGPVMVWDTGYYEIIDKNNDFNSGPLKFKLYGQKLKGIWNLVLFKENNWLLIKEKDKEKGYKDISSLDISIKTGRTMEEIKLNKSPKRQENILSKVKITHPEKIMYPNIKITKQEILEYYYLVSKRMLPFIKNRLISVVRCPKGINKSKFFKKHLESKDLGKVIIKDQGAKSNDYYYIKNLTGLLNEVQMNTIEFHTWGSTVKKINSPDILVFDLDPDENLDLKKVRDGVRDLKKILDEHNLKSYLKTSGGKGYHVVVPIKNKITWDEFHDIAKNIAKLMEAKYPDKYTSNIRKKERKNKIFIDWVRNTKGATSVAPYSLRARKDAPISMPIKWSELDKISPNEITIKNIKKYLKRKDPWQDFFN